MTYLTEVYIRQMQPLQLCVKDVATLGGVITEEDETYSLQKAKKVLEDLDELGDEIDDL